MIWQVYYCFSDNVIIDIRVYNIDDYDRVVGICLLYSGKSKQSSLYGSKFELI